MGKIEFDILQFKDDLHTYSHEYVISKWVLEKTPHIFEEQSAYLTFKIKLSKLLGVDSCSIILVGSASTGFSLSPTKNFKPFDSISDIDIAIISYYYFNIAWHTLQNIDITKQSYEVASIIREHQNRYVYWGTIATDKILGLFPFGKKWVAALEELQKEKEFENRKISFRLYKDHEALRQYHLYNFKENLPKLLGVEPSSIQLNNYGI